MAEIDWGILPVKEVFSISGNGDLELLVIIDPLLDRCYDAAGRILESLTAEV